jgi:malonyl-CoA O-methyltransferase
MTAVQRSFSRAAQSYDRHAEAQRAMAAWLAEWLPAEHCGRALEIGAGTGNFTRLMGHWSDGLVATDIATEMCAIGKIAVPGAQWCVMPAEHPLHGPWDWMFSSAMLQWMKTPEEILTTWKEQLAPGGRIVASLFSAGSLPEWRSVASKVDPVCWRTAAEWRAILATAGLRLMRDEVESRTFRYPSARAFLRSLHGVGAAPQRRLTAGELRRLLDKMDQVCGGIQGVPATWVFYRFEAERS